MTNPHKMMKAAADQLDKLAAQLEQAASTAEQAMAKAAAAEESAKQTKVASANAAGADKARLGQLAKTAAASVRQVGLLSSDKNEDAFASQLLTHENALAKIAELSKYVSAPKLASVVAGGATSAPSADEVWDAKVTQFLNKNQRAG